MENKQLKKVLLVDDDPVFLKGMMYSLKSLGYQTILATGGKEAVKILEKETVDAIVSDINMPEGNGLQLLNYVMKKLSIPVILMTGLSDLKEAHLALDMGAKFFLSKPFKKAELVEALEKCFEPLQSLSEMSNFDNLIRIHLDEFLQGEKLTFPIYMKKYGLLIKLSNGGESLSLDMLRSYRDSGIDSLLAKKEDFIQYLGLTGFNGSTSTAKERIKESAVVCMERFRYIEKFNKNAYHRVQLHLEASVDVLLENPETALLLERIESSGKDYFSRCVYVGIFSSLISQYVGNISTKEYFYLITASLFHELGLFESELLDVHEPIEKLNPKDVQTMISHPEKAAKMISKLNLFPDEVMLMIEQHHETEDGTGYPNKLTSKFIHPLSKIISFADAIAFTLDYHCDSAEKAPLVLSTFTVNTLGSYDTKVIEALTLVFGQSMPVEFIELQLSRLLNPEAA